MTARPMSPNLVRIVAFDPAAHDFAAPLRAALGVADLTALHADACGEEGWSIYKTMERSASYRRWWEVTGSAAFVDRYAHFVRTVVLPLFDQPVLVQTYPTPRIVYADQRGDPRFHRDRDYGHHPAEVNFQVVLTPSVATNAMWIESAPGAGDFHPAELAPGEMLMFDGANLAHGAMPNATGRSRVSFDFRAIRVRDAGAAHLADADANARGAHVFGRFA